MKNSSTSLDAFSTPNIPPLAVLETDVNSEGLNIPSIIVNDCLKLVGLYISKDT